MSDESPSKVLGGLPQTRPHRRSQKRTAPAKAAAQTARTAPAKASAQTARTAPAKAPAQTASAAPPKAPRAKATPTRAARKPRAAAADGLGASPTRLPHQPPQPLGTPTQPSPPHPRRPTGPPDLLGTAVQVGAELVEIGISVSARAIRGVVARLPRP